MKKQKKIFICTLLSASVLVSSSLNLNNKSYAVDLSANGLSYDVLSDSTVAITGYTTDILSELTIPETIDGMTVTKIDDVAFKDCDILNKVIIPESVTYIGDGAFLDCSNLNDIDISAGANYIGGFAFSGTPWLNEMQKNNPQVIVNDILIDGTACSGDITISGNIKIGDGAFFGCSEITSATISEGVTYIGICSFEGCYNMTKISLPLSLKTIDYCAFCNCVSLLQINYAGTSETWGRVLIDNTDNGNEQLSPAILNCCASTDFVAGDANLDGICNVADAIMLQKWLLNAGDLYCWQNVDLCKDGRIDVFDMVMMKRLLIESK